MYIANNSKTTRILYRPPFVHRGVKYPATWVKQLWLSSLVCEESRHIPNRLEKLLWFMYG